MLSAASDGLDAMEPALKFFIWVDPSKEDPASSVHFPGAGGHPSCFRAGRCGEGALSVRRNHLHTVQPEALRVPEPPLPSARSTLDTPLFTGERLLHHSLRTFGMGVARHDGNAPSRMLTACALGPVKAHVARPGAKKGDSATAPQQRNNAITSQRVATHVIRRIADEVEGDDRRQRPHAQGEREAEHTLVVDGIVIETQLTKGSSSTAISGRTRRAHTHSKSVVGSSSIRSVARVLACAGSYCKLVSCADLLEA